MTIFAASLECRPCGFADNPARFDSVMRFLFTHVASPAALMTIGAGTAVFWLDQTLEFWLVVKLTLVVMLVAFHALTGLLVLRVERGRVAGLRLWGGVLTGLICAVLALILWLVLTKPAVPGGWPWSL